MSFIPDGIVEYRDVDSEETEGVAVVTISTLMFLVIIIFTSIAK